MTHEQFITPETARLAKQAGFNWEVQTYYRTPEIGNVRFDADWQVADNQNAVIGRNSAPTQSVLQRWLRDKNILLYVLPKRKNKNWYWDCWYIDLRDKTNIEQRYCTQVFDTFEEALEAGLQKCLTLIVEKQ